MGYASRRNIMSKENCKYGGKPSADTIPMEVAEVLITQKLGKAISLATAERFEKVIKDYPEYFKD